MSNLLIEEMTQEFGGDDMSKIAHEIEALDQSRALVVIGEDLYKIACDMESDELGALAIDTYNMGVEMGACLSKTASEDGAIEESIEMAEDMHKIACVFAELGDETGDETLCKMAEVIIEISNDMQENVDELMKIAAQTFQGSFNPRGNTKATMTMGHRPLPGGSSAPDRAASKKGLWEKAKGGLKFGYGKEAWSAKEIRDIIKGTKGDPKRFTQTMKSLFGSKAGGRALARTGIAYGSAAAALYGGKKMYDRYSR